MISICVIRRVDQGMAAQSQAIFAGMSLEEAHAQLAQVVDAGDPLSFLEAQSKIAEGSSSHVYLAHDRRERRRVAVKRIDLRRARRREVRVETNW